MFIIIWSDWFDSFKIKLDYLFQVLSLSLCVFLCISLGSRVCLSRSSHQQSNFVWLVWFWWHIASVINTLPNFHFVWFVVYPAVWSHVWKKTNTLCVMCWSIFISRVVWFCSVLARIPPTLSGSLCCFLLCSLLCVLLISLSKTLNLCSCPHLVAFVLKVLKIELMIFLCVWFFSFLICLVCFYHFLLFSNSSLYSLGKKIYRIC